MPTSPCENNLTDNCQDEQKRKIIKDMLYKRMNRASNQISTRAITNNTLTNSLANINMPNLNSVP